MDAIEEDTLSELKSQAPQGICSDGVPERSPDMSRLLVPLQDLDRVDGIRPSSSRTRAVSLLPAIEECVEEGPPSPCREPLAVLSKHTGRRTNSKPTLTSISEERIPRVWEYPREDHTGVVSFGRVLASGETIYSNHNQEQRSNLLLGKVPEGEVVYTEAWDSGTKEVNRSNHALGDPEKTNSDADGVIDLPGTDGNNDLLIEPDCGDCKVLEETPEKNNVDEKTACEGEELINSVACDADKSVAISHDALINKSTGDKRSSEWEGTDDVRWRQYEVDSTSQTSQSAIEIAKSRSPLYYDGEQIDSLACHSGNEPVLTCQEVELTDEQQQQGIMDERRAKDTHIHCAFAKEGIPPGGSTCNINEENVSKDFQDHNATLDWVKKQDESIDTRVQSEANLNDVPIIASIAAEDEEMLATQGRMDGLEEERKTTSLQLSFYLQETSLPYMSDDTYKFEPLDDSNDPSEVTVYAADSLCGLGGVQLIDKSPSVEMVNQDDTTVNTATSSRAKGSGSDSVVAEGTVSSVDMTGARESHSDHMSLSDKAEQISKAKDGPSKPRGRERERGKRSKRTEREDREDRPGGSPSGKQNSLKNAVGDVHAVAEDSWGNLAEDKLEDAVKTAIAVDCSLQGDTRGVRAASSGDVREAPVKSTCGLESQTVTSLEESPSASVDSTNTWDTNQMAEELEASEGGSGNQYTPPKGIPTSRFGKRTQLHRQRQGSPQDMIPTSPESAPNETQEASLVIGDNISAQSKAMSSQGNSVDPANEWEKTVNSGVRMVSVGLDESCNNPGDPDTNEADSENSCSSKQPWQQNQGDAFDHQKAFDRSLGLAVVESKEDTEKRFKIKQSASSDQETINENDRGFAGVVDDWVILDGGAAVEGIRDKVDDNADKKEEKDTSGLDSPMLPKSPAVCKIALHQETRGGVMDEGVYCIKSEVPGTPPDQISTLTVSGACSSLNPSYDSCCGNVISSSVAYGNEHAVDRIPTSIFDVSVGTIIEEPSDLKEQYKVETGNSDVFVDSNGIISTQNEPESSHIQYMKDDKEVVESALVLALSEAAEEHWPPNEIQFPSEEKDKHRNEINEPFMLPKSPLLLYGDHELSQSQSVQPDIESSNNIKDSGTSLPLGNEVKTDETSHKPTDADGVPSLINTEPQDSIPYDNGGVQTAISGFADSVSGSVNSEQSTESRLVELDNDRVSPKCFAIESNDQKTNEEHVSERVVSLNEKYNGDNALEKTWSCGQNFGKEEISRSSVVMRDECAEQDINKEIIPQSVLSSDEESNKDHEAENTAICGKRYAMQKDSTLPSANHAKCVDQAESVMNENVPTILVSLAKELTKDNATKYAEECDHSNVLEESLMFPRNDKSEGFEQKIHEERVIDNMSICNENSDMIHLSKLTANCDENHGIELSCAFENPTVEEDSQMANEKSETKVYHDVKDLTGTVTLGGEAAQNFETIDSHMHCKALIDDDNDQSITLNVPKILKNDMEPLSETPYSEQTGICTIAHGRNEVYGSRKINRVEDPQQMINEEIFHSCCDKSIVSDVTDTYDHSFYLKEEHRADDVYQEIEDWDCQEAAKSELLSNSHLYIRSLTPVVGDGNWEEKDAHGDISRTEKECPLIFGAEPSGDQMLEVKPDPSLTDINEGISRDNEGTINQYRQELSGNMYDGCCHQELSAIKGDCDSINTKDNKNICPDTHQYSEWVSNTEMFEKNYPSAYCDWIDGTGAAMDVEHCNGFRETVPDYAPFVNSDLAIDTEIDECSQSKKQIAEELDFKGSKNETRTNLIVAHEDESQSENRENKLDGVDCSEVADPNDTKCAEPRISMTSDGMGPAVQGDVQRLVFYSADYAFGETNEPKIHEILNVSQACPVNTDEPGINNLKNLQISPTNCIENTQESNIINHQYGSLLPELQKQCFEEEKENDKVKLDFSGGEGLCVATNIVNEVASEPIQGMETPEDTRELMIARSDVDKSRADVESVAEVMESEVPASEEQASWADRIIDEMDKALESDPSQRSDSAATDRDGVQAFSSPSDLEAAETLSFQARLMSQARTPSPVLRQLALHDGRGLGGDLQTRRTGRSKDGGQRAKRSKPAPEAVQRICPPPVLESRIKRLSVVDVEAFPRNVPCFYHPERCVYPGRPAPVAEGPTQPTLGVEHVSSKRKPTMWKRLKAALQNPRMAWRGKKAKLSHRYKENVAPPDEISTFVPLRTYTLELPRQANDSEPTQETIPAPPEPWTGSRPKVKVRPPGQWQRFKKFRALRYGAEQRAGRLPATRKQVVSKTNYLRRAEENPSPGGGMRTHPRGGSSSSSSKRRQRRSSPDLLLVEQLRDQGGGGLATRSTPEVGQVLHQDEDLADLAQQADKPNVRMLLKPPSAAAIPGEFTLSAFSRCKLPKPRQDVDHSREKAHLCEAGGERRGVPIPGSTDKSNTLSERAKQDGGQRSKQKSSTLPGQKKEGHALPPAGQPIRDLAGNKTDKHCNLM